MQKADVRQPEHSFGAGAVVFGERGQERHAIGSGMRGGNDGPSEDVDGKLQAVAGNRYWVSGGNREFLQGFGGGRQDDPLFDGARQGQEKEEDWDWLSVSCESSV